MVLETCTKQEIFEKICETPYEEKEHVIFEQIPAACLPNPSELRQKFYSILVQGRGIPFLA